MKRSAALPLVLVTAVAATMTGCKEKRTRYCVDGNSIVVKDDECRDEQHAAAGIPYHWYYVGPHGGGTDGSVAPGTRISGGSTSVPEEGVASPSESETSRGVIGEAGEAAAGHGGGEGGGHGGGGE